MGRSKVSRAVNGVRRMIADPDGDPTTAGPAHYDPRHHDRSGFPVEFNGHMNVAVANEPQPVNLIFVPGNLRPPDEGYGT